ncbi:hypothetical protein V6124_07860 [Klebsiella pneumoniae]
MRYDDVLELLKSIKKDFTHLTSTCEKGRFNEDLNLPPVLLKNILENSRSCLEYIAADAYESIPNHTPGKVLFFPYGPSLHDLMKINRNKWLADLNKYRPDLFSEIINYQDFNLHQDNSWLVEFCKLNNKIKHNSLSRPIRKGLNEKFEIAPGIVISSEAKKVTFSDSQINGQKLKNLIIEGGQNSSKIQKTINDAGLNFKVRYSSSGVEFLTDNGINVISLMNRTIKNIEQLTNEFYKKL